MNFGDPEFKVLCPQKLQLFFNDLHLLHLFLLVRWHKSPFLEKKGARALAAGKLGSGHL